MVDKLGSFSLYEWDVISIISSIIVMINTITKYK